MSYSDFYTIDLTVYKEFKINLMFSDYFELKMISREMIYYIHYSNLIMDLFLSSNENIENALEKISIVSLDDYMNGADLIQSCVDEILMTKIRDNFCHS